jgi:hypothetical protein
VRNLYGHTINCTTARKKALVRKARVGWGFLMFLSLVTLAIGDGDGRRENV